MTQPVIVLFFFGVCSALAWAPGNVLLRATWAWIATYAGKEVQGLTDRSVSGSSPFIRQVGGLERMLYIISVMSHHYEIMAGWLVMKAFFSFTTESRRPVRMLRQGNKTSPVPPNPLTEDEVLLRYNGILIGNALSLLIGLAAGAGANFLVRLTSPFDNVDIQFNSWLNSYCLTIFGRF